MKNISVLKLRAMLLAHECTADELAKAFGIATRSVERWIYGEIRMKPMHLMAILYYLENRKELSKK